MAGLAVSGFVCKATRSRVVILGSNAFVQAGATAIGGGLSDRPSTLRTGTRRDESAKWLVVGESVIKYGWVSTARLLLRVQRNLLERSPSGSVWMP